MRKASDLKIPTYLNVIISHFLARKTTSVVPRALHRQKQPVTTHTTLQRIHRYSTHWLPYALLSRYVILNVHHTQYAITSTNQSTNSDLLVTITTRQAMEDMNAPTNTIKLRSTHKLPVYLLVTIGSGIMYCHYDKTVI